MTEEVPSSPIFPRKGQTAPSLHLAQFMLPETLRAAKTKLYLFPIPSYSPALGESSSNVEHILTPLFPRVMRMDNPETSGHPLVLVTIYHMNLYTGRPDPALYYASFILV